MERLEVREMISDKDVAATFAVMRQLRTHLTEEEYAESVKRMRASDNYRLAAVLDGGRVGCVAGYRIAEFLAHGRILYVDDLVTGEDTRSAGHGRRMLGWLAAEAEKNGCAGLQLDSGTWRHEAHRFYFREGMKISSYHFSKEV